jgi:hypothetical protein
VKIYLAGASAEVARCKALGEWCRRFGHEITFAWWDVVLAAKTHDRDLTEDARVEYAGKDLVGVIDADALWLVVPEERGVGAWIEFGFALGSIRKFPSKRLIVSGDWKKSIFTSLAHDKFDTHEEALAFVQSLGQPEAA